MYIIENGNAYIIKGDKAYKVEFALDKSMKISDSEKDAIDVEGKQKYSYDEIVRKLNVNYMIAKAIEEKELAKKFAKNNSKQEDGEEKAIKKNEEKKEK